MGAAWIFPGQGSEEAGMGLALLAADADARALVGLASRHTGLDLARALERGGRAVARTEVLQPLLVALGLAAARALARAGAAPEVVLGHSLGELTAACWSADLPVEEAVALAAERGRLMSVQAALHPGGMLAVREAGPELEARAAAVGLSIAALNGPFETVLAGDHDAVERGARVLGGTILRVAGAWHTARLTPAVEPMRARLHAAFAGRPLHVPLISAVSGRALAEGEVVDALADGIVRPVRFVDAVEAALARGAAPLIGIAPSRVVRGLVRPIAGRERALLGADDPRTIDAIATQLCLRS